MYVMESAGNLCKPPQCYSFQRHGSLFLSKKLSASAHHCAAFVSWGQDVWGVLDNVSCGDAPPRGLAWLFIIKKNLSNKFLQYVTKFLHTF